MNLNEKLMRNKIPPLGNSTPRISDLVSCHPNITTSLAWKIALWVGRPGGTNVSPFINKAYKQQR